MMGNYLFYDNQKREFFYVKRQSCRSGALAVLERKFGEAVAWSGRFAFIRVDSDASTLKSYKTYE